MSQPTVRPNWLFWGLFRFPKCRALETRLTYFHFQPEETTRLLTRLAQKPGVSSTLILSRATGAVVRASGLISSSATASNADASELNTAPDTALPANNASQADREATLNGTGLNSGDQRKSGTREAEEVAKLVWTFFKSAGDTVEGMFGINAEGDGEDELRLVRLRTRKSEVVVVPGTCRRFDTQSHKGHSS